MRGRKRADKVHVQVREPACGNSDMRSTELHVAMCLGQLAVDTLFIP